MIESSVGDVFKIVEDDTAKLLGYGNNSIQANHMGMTKFGSRF
jgi:hypothetical protein